MTKEMIKFVVLKELPKEFGGSGEQGRTIMFATDSESAIKQVKEIDTSVLVSIFGEAEGGSYVSNTTYSIK